MQRYPEPPFLAESGFPCQNPSCDAQSTSITYRYYEEPLRLPDNLRTLSARKLNAASHFAYSVLACFKMAISGSAFFQSVRKSFICGGECRVTQKIRNRGAEANAPWMRCCKSFRNRTLAPLTPAGVGNPGIPPARYCRYTSNLRSQSCWCKNRRTSCCAIL